MDKLYITHYFYPGTDPWKNIMLLPEEEAFRKAKELADAHPDTTSFAENRSCGIPIRLRFWSANISETGLTAAIRSLSIWMMFPTIRSASHSETAVL